VGAAYPGRFVLGSASATHRWSSEAASLPETVGLHERYLDGMDAAAGTAGRAGTGTSGIGCAPPSDAGPGPRALGRRSFYFVPTSHTSLAASPWPGPFAHTEQAVVLTTIATRAVARRAPTWRPTCSCPTT